MFICVLFVCLVFFQVKWQEDWSDEIKLSNLNFKKHTSGERLKSQFNWRRWRELTERLIFEEVCRASECAVVAICFFAMFSSPWSNTSVYLLNIYDLLKTIQLAFTVSRWGHCQPERRQTKPITFKKSVSICNGSSL